MKYTICINKINNKFIFFSKILPNMNPNIVPINPTIILGSTLNITQDNPAKAYTELNIETNYILGS